VRIISVSTRSFSNDVAAIPSIIIPIRVESTRRITGAEIVVARRSASIRERTIIIETTKVNPPSVEA
jgi:hypothetical protein